MNKIRSFFTCDSGSVTQIFAISSVMLVFAAGIAIDYGRWQAERTELQGVADAAALAAANKLSQSAPSQDSIEAVVKNYVEPNGVGLTGIEIKSVVIDKASNKLTVALEMPAQKSLSAVFYTEETKIGVTTTVDLGKPKGKPMCVVALDGSMTKALEGSGGTAWTAPSCRVQVNSSSSTAVNLSGGSSIKSAENCFVGGVQQGLANLNPAPTPKCQAVVDPFAGLSKPSSAGSCDYNSFSQNISSTLSPGLYCGGLTLKNQTFTFEPGLYIIKDGAFVTSGGATLKGDGVTFFLTGNNAGLTWSGGGNYQLRASTTGSLAGFVVYLDPNATRLAKSVVSGGGDTFYEGILYFPHQKAELSGGSTTTTPSPFTAFVANNFVFSGGSQLNIGIDPTKTSIPIPAGLFADAGAPKLTN